MTTAAFASSDSSVGDVQIFEYSKVIKQDKDSLDPWGKALQQVIKSVVSIKSTLLRSFDTEFAGSYEGTGFVVDRDRGIILSNRHLVNPGPTIATAIFGNYEEIQIFADYYDPVHDFGFFRYDPAKVKFAEIGEIELYPQGAKVGLDVKVCGNNGGERLSIFSTTLARLDRTAPFYGSGYNDFNINYFQAASTNSHGSSGSPVLDIYGRAVALTAGGNSTSGSAFYLPLEPIVRALNFVREGRQVPRGTLQTVFVHSTYDELKRLGLPGDVEKQCRHDNKDGSGLLTVAKILPEGPGYYAGIAVGDILVECYNESFGRHFVPSFNSLWDIVDNSVGQPITLSIYRGQERKDVNMTVQDLHSITPHEFLDVGDTILHPLSYQLARTYHVPCRGLYAVVSGIFTWASSSELGGFLITQLAGIPIDSIESFRRVFFSLDDGSRVAFKYKAVGGYDEYLGIVEIDHHFHGSSLFTRDGSWKRTRLTPGPIAQSSQDQSHTPALEVNGTRNEMVRKILVMIRCRMPYSVDGVKGPSIFLGVGVVVGLTPEPLIVASRATVPTTICDISVTFGKRTIPARILHFGLIVVLTVESRFLPSSLPIPAPSLKEYKIGDDVEVFGLNGQHQLVQRSTEITTISPMDSLATEPPTWRITNTESYMLRECPFTLGGVLLDPEEYTIAAFWMAVKVDGYLTGMSYIYYIHPIIEALRIGNEIEIWSPGWEFNQISSVKAMDLGVSEHRAIQLDKIADAIGAGSQAIWVIGKLRQSGSDLEVGDFILQINDQPVGRMADIRFLSYVETSKLLILRNRQEMEIMIHSQKLPSRGLAKIICWAGAVLQRTPLAALEQATPEFNRTIELESITEPENLVYISSYFSGSPASGTLTPTLWLLEIDRQKVLSLETLLDIIPKLKGRGECDEYIQVKLVGRLGATLIVGLKPNPQFWPAWVLEQKENRWVRTELE